MMNLEYLYATVKPGIVCSFCKDLFNSMAECRSICAALGQEWSWTSRMFSVTELVRRFGFTLFIKPWKQLTNPFRPLRNCREMEQLVIHSSPSSSWWLFIWQNLLSECWPRWVILHSTHWDLAAERVLTFQCHNCHSMTFLSNPWCCLQHTILLPRP